MRNPADGVRIDISVVMGIGVVDGWSVITAMNETVTMYSEAHRLDTLSHSFLRFLSETFVTITLSKSIHPLAS